MAIISALKATTFFLCDLTFCLSGFTLTEYAYSWVRCCCLPATLFPSCTGLPGLVQICKTFSHKVHSIFFCIGKKCGVLAQQTRVEIKGNYEEIFLSLLNYFLSNISHWNHRETQKHLPVLFPSDIQIQSTLKIIIRWHLCITWRVLNAVHNISLSGGVIV